MKIEDYCRLNEISKRKLAVMCGIPPQTLYNIKSNSTITLHNAIAIMIGTNGEVHPWDLLPDKDLAEISAKVQKQRDKEKQKKERLRQEIAGSEKNKLV